MKYLGKKLQLSWQSVGLLNQRSQVQSLIWLLFNFYLDIYKIYKIELLIIFIYCDVIHSSPQQIQIQYNHPYSWKYLLINIQDLSKKLMIKFSLEVFTLNQLRMIVLILFSFLKFSTKRKTGFNSLLTQITRYIYFYIDYSTKKCLDSLSKKFRKLRQKQ